MATSLINRNITVGKRRTSMRLEAELWDALAEMCHREGITMAEMVTRISASAKHTPGSLTSAVRVAISRYFRRGCTEDGHASAAHGTLTGPTATGWRPADMARGRPAPPAQEPQP